MSCIGRNRHDERLLLHATSELEKDADLRQKDVVQNLRCKLLFINSIYFNFFMIYIFFKEKLIINLKFFLQEKYHWSMGVTERVRKAFYAKAKVRLLDTIFNWKGDWIVKGYGKPAELTMDVWDGLIHYWWDPESIRIVQSCSASRNTVDGHGHGPMLHSTDQKPHAGVR